ncbi:hypothetical protein ABZ477_14375 [Microbacterium sp. NPDC019599]|uniref:hypothetical protein n=1 Tax=Microbacterium sp. NPDC019599 TaxID=3154690 RepID=UPI0033F60149
MPDDERRFELSLQDLEGLTPAKLNELKEKHGLSIEIRSSSSGINEILDSLGKVETLTGHERGFDRTDPGYSRSYDREVSTLEALKDEVINPAILNRNIGRIQPDLPQ